MHVKEAASSGDDDAVPTGIRCVLAPNPSTMTQNGTNTYIIGSGRVAVIDPGPAVAEHQAAILAALSPGESISHIFVSHAHLDHSGLATSLARATGAAVYAFGSARAGRSATMQRLADLLPIGGGEGVDHDFHPDICLADGACVEGDTWQLKALHTPGHMGNHLCFVSGDVLFSGDHVMGWSTSLISPPDGDMTDYMAALTKLQARQWDRFLPGHGDPISNPAQRLADLLAHRRGREAALLAALVAGASDIAGLTRVVYPDLAVPLIPAARRNVLAQLIDLEGRNLIIAQPFPHPNAIFTLP
jgi:glyoxylase-like metal-dependent hydrolase (beta-lactamase superfamily II)